MENTFECIICGKVSTGWGNNPWPVKEEGECCGGCNSTKVIPARLRKQFEKKEEEETSE